MIGALGGGLKAGITLYAIDRMSATVNSATTKAEASMKQMQMRNDAMNKSMLQTSQYLSMMKVGLAGMAVSGVAIGASVKQFTDFQKSLAYISTLIDDVNFDIKEKIGKDVLRIAGETGKDIQDIMSGVYQAISTSIEPEKATQFIEVVSKAAVAGNASIETSANAILTVLKSYGLETGRAMEVSDKLFQTVKLGRVEFPQLSDAIADFAQTGALAGVSLDELLGAFAALTMVGVPVDEASTSLNRFLLSVVDASKESKEFAKSLNLDFSVEHMRKVGILAFLDEISAKVGTDITQIQKLFPEIRAFRAVAPLMDTARDSFKKFSGEISESSGTTEKAMEKMENTISHRVDTIKQKMKGIGIKLGETFALSLEGPINKFDELLGKILENDKAIQGIGIGLKAIFGVGGVLAGLGTIGWLTKTIGGIGAGFKAGLTGQALVSGGAIATGAKTVGAAVGGLTTTVAGPIALGTAAYIGERKLFQSVANKPVEAFKESVETYENIKKEIERINTEIGKTTDESYKKQLAKYLSFLMEQEKEQKLYINEMVKKYKEENVGFISLGKTAQKGGLIGNLAKALDTVMAGSGKTATELIELMDAFQGLNRVLEKTESEIEWEAYSKYIKEEQKPYFTSPYKGIEEMKMAEFQYQEKLRKEIADINLTVVVETPEGKTSYKIKKSIEDLQRENTIRLKSIGVPYPE